MRTRRGPGYRVFFTSLLFFTLLNSLSRAALVDSAQARRLFKNPPRQYSTGPLWVWNDLLTEDQVRQGLRDLASQKIRQVWVHPRPGLMTPYLSTDWFRLWKVALAEARRLDMNVWIYDENSYPSGFAGGFVPEALPGSRGQGLVFSPTDHAPHWSTNVLGIYVIASNVFEHVTARVRAGELLPETNYLVASRIFAPDSPWNANRPYVNLLNPGVTEKFLELTLEPYRREIGNELGRRVPGVFTDEPNIRPTGGWPWSPGLEGQFKQRWGYDLLDHLPSLNRQVGDWRRVRYDYFQLLNEQFIEHWSKPYHDYCARNGLQWTGHYWDHEWPRCLSVPDNMAMYAWHQTPAIDCLMNQYEERIDSQFGNVRIVRELSSVANQLGMERTLCETYGAGGWDLRFEDMKRIGDWLEVLGVNTINQHLSYVTIRGARKRDHPQSFSYHEPWWNAYHVSAAYLARLSAALSQGEQVNRILVLEPTTTAWMYQGDNDRLKNLGAAFLQLLQALDRPQVEYDLGSEDLLGRHGSVGPGGLKVGRREYQTVLLPALTENLNPQTMALLEAFLASGGTVLSCGPAPSRIEGRESERGAALARSSHWKAVTVGEVAPQLMTTGFAIKRAPGDKGILLHQRRLLKDGQLLFLVNSSLDSRSTATIKSALSGIERWNPYTGECESYPFERTAEGVKADFQLEPSGSLLLFLSNRALRPAPARQDVVKVICAEAPPVIRRMEDNVLVLDYVDVSVGSETKSNCYCFDANKFVWRHNGFEKDPWDNAVQFKDELITKKFAPNHGFEAAYKFTIQGEVPTNLVFVLERPDLYTIDCNGRELIAAADHWWLDKSFGRIPIFAMARCGENTVTIKASSMTMFHELEPAYVLGTFTLEAVDQGFEIRPDRLLRLGDVGAGKTKLGWNSQGHPFYGAKVCYQERFRIDRKQGRFEVKLNQWYGSVAEVIANGHRAGFIDAPPWERDVTQWVKSGENSVEVNVVGTLKNTLGPHHGNPVLGAAWPRAFQVGSNPGPPPGTNYSTVAYGLFEPFVLKQTIQRPLTIE